MQSIVSETDVLIVGAGPTGLCLASELVDQNVTVRIVDRKPGITDLSKALAVQARTLELFDRIGLAGEAVASGHAALGLDLTIRGRTIQAIELGDIGQGESPYPYVLILPQSETERLLETRVRNAGQAIEWRTEFQALTQDASGVTATLVRGGIKETVRARYVVGADGASSLVREGAGIAFRGGTYERNFYLADVAMEGPLDHARIHLVLSRGRFLACFPMPGQRRFRVLGFVPRALESEDSLNFDQVRAIIEGNVELDLRLTDCRWVSTFRLHHRMAARFAVGRVFLCGDAAHIHSPAGGQGMNTGIQDAINLAWKLGLVLRDGVHPRLLDTYGLERIPFARRLLRLTDRGFRVMTGRGRLFDVFRLHVLPRVLPVLARSTRLRRFAFRTVSQIGIQYRDSPLSRDVLRPKSGCVRAGERLPPGRVVRDPQLGPEDLYALLDRSRFTALVFAEPAPFATAAIERLCRPIFLPNREENRWLAEKLGVPDGVALVRPDAMLAYRGPAEAQALELYLQEVSGPGPG